MTALATELDRKLSELDSERARLLERLVRDAMTLAEGSPTKDRSARKRVEPPGLTRITRIELSAADYERFLQALDRPPRDLPRLRRLLRSSSRFKDE